MGALHLINRDADGFTGLPYRGAILEASKTDLGALQVSQDADGTTGFFSGLADPLVILFMIGVIAMGEVQSGNIHAVLNEPQNSIRAGNRRAKGAYNLRSSFHTDQPNPFPLHLLQRVRIVGRQFISCTHCISTPERPRQQHRTGPDNPVTWRNHRDITAKSGSVKTNRTVCYRAQKQWGDNGHI